MQILEKNISEMLDEHISSFLKKISMKYSIDYDELKNIWDSSENNNDNSSEKVLENYGIWRRDMLVTECKKKNLKYSGTKEVLINRLLGKPDIPSKKSTSVEKKSVKAIVNFGNIDKIAPVSKKKKMIEIEKKNISIEENAPILKKLLNNRPQLVIKRNKYNNLEHEETGFIFTVKDNGDKEVIAKQNNDGSISNLTEKDIQMCKKWNFIWDITRVDIDGKDDDDNILLTEEEDLTEDPYGENDDETED